MNCKIPEEGSAFLLSAIQNGCHLVVLMNCKIPEEGRAFLLSANSKWMSPSCFNEL